MVTPIDAVLFVSFGGPEKPDEVMPFLRGVVAGRNVPDERLAVVAEQYNLFGGRSPINDQNKALIAALREELDRNGSSLPIYWGNRNWGPYLTDAMEQMKADGIKHAAAFVTSAYSSYSGCRQYKEDIARAQEAVEGAPVVTKIRQYFNHPGFIAPMVDNVRIALASFPIDRRANARLAFTAHSIPLAMAEHSRYQSQLLETARLIVEELGDNRDWEMVFQSRSGNPRTPWLEPDISDHLRDLHDKEVDDVVMVPIGFISDHMEVRYDLDTLAMQTARELSMNVVRAHTVGTDPRFVTTIRELVFEHIEQQPIREALGLMGPVGCLGDACCLPE